MRDIAPILGRIERVLSALEDDERNTVLRCLMLRYPSTNAVRMRNARAQPAQRAAHNAEHSSKQTDVASKVLTLPAVDSLDSKTLESKAFKAVEPTGFAEFWNAYPRRKDRNRAQKAYAQALKRGDAQTIFEGLRKQRNDMLMRIAQGESKYVPHPTTWLNNDRWNDEADVQATVSPKATGPAVWLSMHTNGRQKDDRQRPSGLCAGDDEAIRGVQRDGEPAQD